MISLKTYNQEIEQLIDNGLYDEAIAHCIHILSIYPKCIDSYRNLGKSLLELKKYPDALDVFSRVLSAIPDDFISHVGLSIIFEDQNNLDLAIWHMEQAFDVQPSNLTIQDELKRLFGQRDGEQPTKIRLTRGALVRMYARGELFQQAITEINSILEEDPRRIDLEVILARMHYFSGAIDESTAVCNRIIEKIPFCFEVNRILQQIHINKNDSEGADLNKNRLINLDPYYQFLPNPFSDQEVSENKVLLEKLQYIPSKDTGTQIPAWLEDIDESKEKKSDESFDWLGNLNKNKAPITNPVLNSIKTDEQVTDNHFKNVSIPSDENLPDWMKTAGWNTNLGSETNDVIQSSNSQHFESQELISEAQSNDQPKEIKTGIGSKVTNEDLASLFTELKEGKMENDDLTSDLNDEKQYPPSDWMSQFSNPNGPVTSEPSDQDFPDWLKNFQAEEPQIIQNSDDMPDWLKNLQSEVEPIVQSSDDSQNVIGSEINGREETTFDNIFTETEQIEDTPTIDEPLVLTSEKEDGWESIDMTKDDIDESPESINEPTEPVVERMESVEGSIESVNEAIEPVEESINIVNKPEQSSYISSDDKIPDWVKSVLIDQTSDAQKTQTQGQESYQGQVAIPSSQEAVDSGINSDEVVMSDSESDAGIISQQTNDELLDWLRGLKTEEEPLQQNEEPSISIETPLVNVIEDEPSLELEDSTLADILFPKEEVDVAVYDQEQATLIDEKSIPVPFSAENDCEPVFDQEQPTISAFEDYEFPKEGIESSSTIESIQKIQTSELHPETIIEYQDLSSVTELIQKGDFENLSNAVSFSIDQGQNFDQILSTLTAAENEHGTNFSYWQCLGDIYSKNNHLNDALLAYQKAEDILTKTISS